MPPCMRLFECPQAAQKPKGSMERLLLVAAFAQSAFQAVGKLKAMVPIMGETYEVHSQQTFLANANPHLADCIFIVIL